MYKCLLFIVCLLFADRLCAQTPSWAFNVGSTTDDYTRAVKVAPNGNVYIAGLFTGTMDLDPGPGVHNITSNGLTDIFLACYSSAGNFLWGFGIGGPNYDGAFTLAVDTFNNVIVGGAIQSGGIDFDPGAGTYILPYAGGFGLSSPEGDGFIAKYSSAGNFLWAKDLGGPNVYDYVAGVATDTLGNVYVCGTFSDMMTISSTITFNSSTAGTGYLIKYNAAGTVIWGHNFGEYGIGGVDCIPFALEVSNGNIYTGGEFKGTANFDPWGTPAWCTVGTGGPSSYNPFVAKYDTAGNFIFVRQINGTGVGQTIYTMVLDSADNIYAMGWGSSSSMTLDPSSPGTTTYAAPGGGGNDDIFMVKYNSSGTYQWGFMLGGPGTDWGIRMTLTGGYLYCTGQFENTVDMDPSTAVANLVSNGMDDIYITKYDLNGHYICGFNVGSAGTNDVGWAIAHDAGGAIYAGGGFGGSLVDFDPSPGVYPLTSIGGEDVYLAKYIYSSSTALTGHLVGDTICPGQTAYLTLVVTTGSTGPFTITYSDGTTTYTQTGVMSGVPFTLTVSPTVTTTYTITSITYPGMNLCTAPSGTVFGSAVVVVVPAPVATITATQILCNEVKFSSVGTDGTTYLWNFGDGTSSTINPVTHVYSATGTFTVVVTVTNPNGCSAVDSTTVNITAPPVVNLGPDTSFCTNNPVYTITPSGTFSPTATYLWSTGSTASSITVTTSGTYWLTVSDNGCTGRDSVKVIFKPVPEAVIGNDTVICPGNTLTLGSVGVAGTQYSWSTGSTDSSIVITDAGSYTLTVNLNGCKATASINVTVGVTDSVSLGPDTTLCIGDEVVLHVNNNSAIWNTNQRGPSIKVNFAGTYWVTIPEQCGDVSDTIKVDFHICDIGFPSAFTPNGDGLNDVIGVVGTLKYYNDFSLSIYNRWGQRVFYTEDIYAGWDGIFNGTKQDLGTYFYMIFYSLEGKKHMMKGDFQLIR